MTLARMVMAFFIHLFACTRNTGEGRKSGNHGLALLKDCGTLLTLVV